MAVMPRVDVHVIDHRSSTRFDLDAVLQRWSDMTGRWAEAVSGEYRSDGTSTVTVRIGSYHSYERARADAAELDQLLREIMPVGVDIRIEGEVDGVRDGRVSLLGGSNYWPESNMVVGASGRVLGVTAPVTTIRGVRGDTPPAPPPARRWTRYDHIMAED